jgi:SAM-dependent methyltransferase
MELGSHEQLVARQFGPRAQAYVASTVHAHGEDLDRLAVLAHGVAPARALDLGCGGGHVALTLAPHAGHVVAYDLADEMLTAVAAVAEERGLSNLQTECGVAEQIPFDDATFDLVVTRFSAHHWRDVVAGVREAARVLRPGGRAVFIDIAGSEKPVLDTHLQAIEVLRDSSHVRDYTPREWRALLGGAGLAIRSETPELHVRAIRSLQSGASDEVVRAFEIDASGSFTSDVIWLDTYREAQGGAH